MTDIICGESRLVMNAMPPDTFDAIVTDPPYNLSFMGKDWDKPTPGSSFSEYFHGGAYQRWTYLWSSEALRILKPGGHLVVFGGTRTWHRMACGIEDAGFEIRDCLMWLYGTGFPKSLDVSKAIDKAAGAERPAVRRRYDGVGNTDRSLHKREGLARSREAEYDETGPATSDAETWEGWGTALKPAWEPILLARKPLGERTVAANVLRWGTGALNIGATRIPSTPNEIYGGGKGTNLTASETHHGGRWPANLVLGEEAAGMLDEEAGYRRTGRVASHSERGMWGSGSDIDYADQEKGGGPSRFFYCAKASTSERGPDNPHPTVKPVDLMQWLVRLITPPDGLILDPFVGSGTTLLAATSEGFRSVGIDLSLEYCQIARRRS